MQNKYKNPLEETPIGKMLKAKIHSFNNTYHTDFEVVVTDDHEKPHDWLYCLKVGNKYLFNEGEYDGQEMYAYICGMFHGAMIGKNHGR